MKTSKKFLAIIIPLLVIIPVLVGYSLWLVGEKKEEIPTYTFKDLLENNITLNATYTGSLLDITKEDVQKNFKVNFDIDWDSFNVSYWDKDGNTEIDPKNAGEYKVKITSKYEEVVEGATKETAELTFVIAKATPIIDVSKIIITPEEGNQFITSSSEISKLIITAEEFAANHNGANVAGKFTLKEQQLEVGKKEYSGIFKPSVDDETNFTEAEFKISINVYATVTLELGNHLTAGSNFSDNNTLYIDTTDDGNNKLNLNYINAYILPAIHYQFIADKGWFVKDNAGNVAVKWDFDEKVSSDLCLVAMGMPITYQIGYEVENTIGADTSGLPTSFTVEKKVNIGIPTVDNYIFCGWFDNDKFNGDPITSLDITSCNNTNEHTHNIKLYPKLIQIPTISDPDSYIYNGTEQTCKLSISPDDLKFVTITGNNATNAGSYPIIIKVKNSIVNSSEYTIGPWEIKKRDVTFDSDVISITNATVPSAGTTIEYSDNIKFDFEKANIEGLISNDIKYTYTYEISNSSTINFAKKKCTSKSCTVKDLSTDLKLPLGNYKVNVSIELYVDDDEKQEKLTNYENVANITGEFVIDKLRIYIKPDIKTLSPLSDEYSREWDSIQTYLNNNSTIYRFLNKTAYSKNTVSSCIGMQDGQFIYGESTINTQLDNTIKITSFEGDKMSISTNAESYVVGSTYYAYFKANENYEFVNAENGNNTNINNFLIFKYQTVYNGSEYMTIEDALNSSYSTFYVWGNADNNTSYGLTTFTSLDEIYNTNEYVRSNISLYLPYALNSSSLSEYFKKSDDNTKAIINNPNEYYKVFSCLIIPSKITLKLSNSTLAVCSMFYDFAQSTNSSTLMHGVIYNNGTIDITNSKVYAYGYIKGIGRLNLLGSTNAYDILKTSNWSGGTAATDSIMSESNFWGTKTKYQLKAIPFSYYSFHNISCETKITSGVNYYGRFITNLKIIGYTDAEVVLLGSKDASSCLFKPTDYDSYIIKKAMKPASNSSASSLYMITGSNQVAGQRDTIEIYGNYNDCTFSFSISLSLGSASLSTSTSMTLPVSYLNLIIKNESSLTLSNCDYAFLPGTSMLIENGGICMINSNVDLNITKYDDIKNYLPKNSCIDTVNANLTVNGNLVINSGGNIGGYINTTAENANLIVTGNTTASYTLYYTPNDPMLYTGTTTATISTISNDSIIENNCSNNCGYLSKLNVSENKYYYWEYRGIDGQYTVNYYIYNNTNNEWELFNNQSYTYNIYNGIDSVIEIISVDGNKYYAHNVGDWYTDTSCTQNYINIEPEKNKTYSLYLKEVEKQYTINYAVTNDSTTYEKETLTYLASKGSSLKGNSELYGWNSDIGYFENGKTLNNIIEKMEENNVTEITLYACYVDENHRKYTITYNYVDKEGISLYTSTDSWYGNGYLLKTANYDNNEFYYKVNGIFNIGETYYCIVEWDLAGLSPDGVNTIENDITITATCYRIIKLSIIPRIHMYVGTVIYLNIELNKISDNYSDIITNINEKFIDSSFDTGQFTSNEKTYYYKNEKETSNLIIYVLENSNIEIYAQFKGVTYMKGYKINNVKIESNISKSYTINYDVSNETNIEFLD